MSMNGSRATSPRERIEALYVTSFPTKSYRRPIMAVRALKLLGAHSTIIEGWKDIAANKPAFFISTLSRFLPAPLEWMVRDIAYELEVYRIAAFKSYSLYFNLNVVGALGMRVAAWDKPLILDMQDFTIQDDHTIPLYDEQILKLTSPDLVIFASEPIKKLVENRYPKLIRKTAYIPFGIDLSTFDRHYKIADPLLFKSRISAGDASVLVYTGAAYLWGDREGQGIELLLKSVKFVSNQMRNIKLIIQGAARPGSNLFAWIMTRIKGLGLESIVTMLPPMDPYSPLRMSMMKAADVLLLPIGDILGTYYATQQKLFEYMAASRPIAMVATPARLCVLNEKGAYIAYKRNPQEFAAAIVEALTNKDEAEVRAARARTLVEEKYDWRLLIPQYAEQISPFLNG